MTEGGGWYADPLLDGACWCAAFMALDKEAQYRETDGVAQGHETVGILFDMTRHSGLQG